MDDGTGHVVGKVEMLFRYPVKSMLGETCDALLIERRGVVGDRSWAVLDGTTGKVASAKRPKLWRRLLTCEARTLADAAPAVIVRLPDSTTGRAGEPALDASLASLTGRAVRLTAVPPDDAELDRSYPEVVLAEGADADVGSDILKLGAAAPPGTFLDYAPVHLLTTATLDSLSAAMHGDAVEPARYRPNIVVCSPPGGPAFPENGWIGAVVRIGDAVTLRVVLQTPRCAIPALAHGKLPERPAALRAAVERNRVEVPGFGDQPCAGIYAQVVQGGTVRPGDSVTLLAA